MAERLDREAVGRRLRAVAGSEDLLAWGWGVLGMRNVLAGATPTRLVLETITLALRTKSVEHLEYSRLEGISAGSGDSSMPGWAKLNLGAAIAEGVTTHLVVKPSGEPPRHYLFRPMPFYGENRKAGLEIGLAISRSRPDLPTEVDLKSWRASTGAHRSWLRWGLWGAVSAAAILGIALRSPGGAAAGAFAGFLLGAASGLVRDMVRIALGGKG